MKLSCEDIKTFPNQKVVQVKKTPCTTFDKYIKLDLTAFNQALAELSTTAFKLYMYFSSNVDNFAFALSNKAVFDKANMKKTQYDNAISELIEKGYLTQQKGNIYFFYDKIPNSK